ncbi:hypothetical protein EAY64_05445, partial [Aquitalea palustris]
MATTKKRTSKAAAPAPTEVLTAFKGFNKDLRCRDFQYAVGETYTHEGKVKACESGFHACEAPLDVFSYYPPADSRFALVKATGAISRESNSSDTKIASAVLTVEAEIGLPGLLSRAVEWVMAKIDHSIEQTLVTGNRSAATNTGN